MLRWLKNTSYLKAVGYFFILFAACLIAPFLWPHFVSAAATNTASDLTHWILSHRWWLLPAHAVLYTAVYWGWGIKVRHAASQNRLAPEAARTLLTMRWWLLGGIFIIDCLYFTRVFL